MDKAKEKLLHKTYDRFLKTSLNIIPPGKMEDFVDLNIMGYGTITDEKILSISKYCELVNKQKEQGQGFDFTSVLRRILGDDNCAFFC